jgi:ABC-type phosphate transport system substrate-binding protein
MHRSAIVAIVMSAVLLVFLWGPARVPLAAASAQEALPRDQDLAIIVNRANPVDDLSTAELRRVFLGERSHWQNGRRITLVMLEPGQPEREAVLHTIYRMSEKDFSRHFLQGLFTGEVFVSPKTLASPIGMRKFIFNVPGAIGYLRASDVDDSIKVLRIDGHLPTDKEYSLHVPLPSGE